MKEKKPVKQFKPIKVHCENPSDIFTDNKLEIATAIIHAIDFALKNRKKKVVFAQVIIKNIMAKKFVRLTESELIRLINKIIKEDLQKMMNLISYNRKTQ